MTVHPTFPGVYVQEVPSGVRTIMGVGTSTALFIGRSTQGPMNSPVRCPNYTDFVRTFSDDTSAGALANYVKLFFLNGGTDCYIMRIANGAKRSFVTLQNDAGTPVLKLIAKDPGLAGEMIRAAVTYNGVQPEITFNIDLFRWVVDSAGNRTKQGAESFKNLSMDPASPLYAVDLITQNSKLVSAELPPGPPPGAGNGFSLSGRLVDTSGTNFTSIFVPLLSQRFELSVGGSPYKEINLTGLSPTDTEATATPKIQAALDAQFPPANTVTISFQATAGDPDLKRLQLASAGRDVVARSGSSPDLCVPLMMGTANGGIEVGARAAQRPAANGIVFDASDRTVLDKFALTLEADLTGVKLDMLQPDGSFVPTVITAPLTTGAAGAIWQDGFSATVNGHSDGVREKLQTIANAVNAFSPIAPALSKWRAELWGSRLALIPTDVGDNYMPTSTSFHAEGAALPATYTADIFNTNVHYYSVGLSGASIGKQASPSLATDIGSDGAAPQQTDYEAAYVIVDKEVDLFNLMVLPPDAAVAMSTVYPNASVFCQQRRAFLLMDAPPGWSGAQQATTGVAALRIGMVKDHSALFYPRLMIDDKGLRKFVGPSGAIAGLCARIDGTRGVWKAPAGVEADLRGILGVEQRFSDSENGILNPRAVNTIRVFPSGIVNWGARTFDGDDDFASEYKYIPIRRLALFMEESLYRGLKWVVFEPNDEPLYSQIRLNVGSFMHGLFRQGAFQGGRPKDAYFVKCDLETTTQADRNQGIVNIWVGFAPLKPAEFVILYLQQMAGQIQV